ncbi:MAG: DUF2334 domain-containing protein [Nanoarchaeota archaeon]|nr:DUF2334 domain-containing protein [Nanoarchaeota archaeon]
MTEKFLNIHLEGMDDAGEKLKRILDENIPVAISVCPETLRENGIYREQYPYLPKYIDLIGKVISRGGNILGQQGNIHKCKHNHRFVDPWHENYCLYHRPIGGEKQRELMEEGKETLVKLFGKSPEMYVPPNHLWDFTTLSVANSMGYPFFVIKGIKTSKPLLYKKGGENTLVLPERKIDQEGYFHYTHYDEIEKNREAFEEVVKNAIPFVCVGDYFSMRQKYVGKLYEASPEELTEDLKIIRKNGTATIIKKLLRDVRNLPGRVLEK